MEGNFNNDVLETPNSFDADKFESSLFTDHSKDSEGLNKRTITKRIFAKCCCLQHGDIWRLCTQCLICCPCVLIIGSLVLVVAILISFFTGRISVREKNKVSAGFYGQFISQHLMHAKLGVHSLANMKLIQDFVCNPENYTEEKSEVDEYLLKYVELNCLFLHHIRIVLANGSEINRVDLEHDSSAEISSVLYDVSTKGYHKSFLANKSRSEAYLSDWQTHGPLPNGAQYKYTKDEFLPGDHHSDHIEYLPLPQVVYVFKDIVCSNNDDRVGGYVIFNIRMVVVLKEIDATNELYNIIIVNENGDYVFFNRDRTKEFQSDLGKEKTLSDDWGIGSDGILSKLFTYDEEEFTIGLNEFLCEKMLLSDHEYRICVVVASLQSLLESPVPIVVGIMVDIFFVGILLCCYFNFLIRRESRKYETLVGNLYPKQISKPLLRGNKVISRYQKNLVIMFADIVQFVKFNDSFNNDPNILVIVLGNLIEVIDAFSSLYNVYKIKTIGDCYFSVSGLQFSSKKYSSDKLKIMDFKNTDKMIKFCALFLRFFKKRRIYLPKYNLDISCPKWRIGIAFGGAVSGILNAKTPYFDLWGRAINLAARMESSGVPQKIHCSKRIFEILKGSGSNSLQYSFMHRKVFIKGFGNHQSYLIDLKSKLKLDIVIKNGRRTFLKKFKNLFILKKYEDVEESLEVDNSRSLLDLEAEAAFADGNSDSGGLVGGGGKKLLKDCASQVNLDILDGNEDDENIIVVEAVCTTATSSGSNSLFDKSSKMLEKRDGDCVSGISSFASNSVNSVNIQIPGSVESSSSATPLLKIESVTNVDAFSNTISISTNDNDQIDFGDDVSNEENLEVPCEVETPSSVEIIPTNGKINFTTVKLGSSGDL